MMLESVKAKPRWLVITGTVFSALAGLGIFVLMALTVFDVGRRDLEGHGVKGVVEISEVLLAIVAFLGMLGAQLNGQHIKSPIVTNRLPDRSAHLTRAVGSLLACGLAAWATWLTVGVAKNSIASGEYRFGLVQVPLWPAKVAIPLGLGCFALALALDFLVQVRKFVNREPARDHDFEGLP